MGLGTAILRLVHVELKYSQGVHAVPTQLKDEREMLVSALNQYELSFGMDCNTDTVTDTVDLFKQSAETSCCRISSPDTSRRRRG